jgi:amidase
MLACLRHRTFVGSDHEKSGIETADPSEHILDEALVPRNIDDTQSAATRERHPGETEIDRHLPFLFLAEPVGIDPSECLDERRFSVIDVPSSADDEGLTCHPGLEPPTLSRKCTVWLQRTITTGEGAGAVSVSPYRIPRSSRYAALDATALPALRVETGAVVEFETSDEPYEMLARGILVEEIGLDRFNQVTGPLAVKGARPGDTLRVDILSISIERAWLVFIRSFGPLGRLLPKTVCERLDVDGGRLVVSERLQLPLRPSIGCIGVAPARGASSTFRPVWPWGGNLDLVELHAGSTIWLPVQRPEAFLFLGDVHAAIGAGEPAHVAIEAAARVTVQVAVDHRLRLPGPLVRSDDELLVFGLGPDISSAQQAALENAVALVRRAFELTTREAYAFVCACLSYRFGGPAGPVVVAALPLAPVTQLSGSAIPSWLASS